ETTIVTSIANVSKNRKNKKKKKQKKAEEFKSDKTKIFHHKTKKTYGLPDFILSLSVNDVMKLPFWTDCIQKTGKVVYIFERNHPRVAGGKLKLTADRNVNYALFSPNDSKIPRMLIDMKQCPPDFFVHPEHYSQTLFLAKLEDWSETSMFPKGTLLKSLGNVGQIEAESEIILIENQIDDSEHDAKSCQQFTNLLNVNNEFEIPQKERDTRRSFEADCVFTIDPSTARDLDDALSVTELTDKAHNGRTLYEVGVHIADVSYFLLSGSDCDLIARQRTTSVYLVQKVIPMLPRILCEKLCSLNPGEAKLTFSVIWKMDCEGNIYEERVERTIIKSCVKLSYELAQDMIDNPEKQWSQDSLPTIYGNWNPSVISNRVNILMAIARHLRKRRFDSGALNIDAAKLSFVLDPESGLPIGFTPESRRESNFLVEELMLAANMAVAHKVYEAFPNLAFLRRHAPPDAKLLREFQEFCENTNLRVDVSTPEKLKSTVSKLVSESNMHSKVISYYFLRSLTMAVYFCSGMCASKEIFQHYALNVPLYTHFTSPIRRYADVIVHRLLAASLNYTEELKEDERDLHRLAKRCNDNKMAAANASEQSSKLFTNLYLKQVGSVIEIGVVSQVLDHAFDVMLPKFGQMSRVFIETLDLKSFQYRSQGKLHQLELIWNNVDESESLQIIRAFSTVSVRITVSENDIWKWNVTLLPNKQEEAH
ncbi:DIS3-like exonuclease 2, partial [Leptotrombidium deliense]